MVLCAAGASAASGGVVAIAGDLSGGAMLGGAELLALFTCFCPPCPLCASLALGSCVMLNQPPLPLPFPPLCPFVLCFQLSFS